MCPIWLSVFLLFIYNEPELGAGVNSGMALTPLPSSIGKGLNPQPSYHEPSALPLWLMCLLIDAYEDLKLMTRFSLLISWIWQPLDNNLNLSTLNKVDLD